MSQDLKSIKVIGKIDLSKFDKLKNKYLQKEQNSYKDNEHDDYHDNYYNVCRTVPNGGISEYSDFIKKHY
jgi:hypothetical protein